MLQRPVKEIEEKIWLISEYYLVNMYLIEGTEKSLLIDCGVGMGDLKEEVEALTKKPIVLTATHGHIDHDGGAAQFGTIYMDQQDIPDSKSLYEEHGPEIRDFYIKTRGKARNPKASMEELLALQRPNGIVNRVPLPDSFDLGDRIIEVILTPGHTAGSVCYLDPKTRLLFTGDMANDCVLLNLPNSTTLETYLESMKKIWQRSDDFDAICIGHDSLKKEDKTIIKDYIEGAELLLSGEAVGKEGNDALHQGVCFQHKRALIWYLPERMFNESTGKNQ